MASLAARLQKFEDKEEIPILLLDYGRHLDNRDFAAYGALRQGRRVGRRLRHRLGADRPTSRRSWRRHGHGPNPAKNYHLLSNFVITVNGDTATAWSRWAFVVPGERGAAISQAGRYDDTLVRENGRWKFKRRVASNDTPAPAPAPESHEDAMKAFWLACPVFVVLFVVVPRGQQAARIDDAALTRAGPDRRRLAHLWHQPGGDALQPAHEINTTNVTRLSLAWSYDVGSGGGGQEATPLVANGTIYGITNWSIVFAVDALNGQREVAVGSAGQPGGRATGDLLRRRQSRGCALQRHGVRPGHRRTAPCPRCQYRQTGVGSTRQRTRRITTRSRWRRVSPRAR